MVIVMDTCSYQANHFKQDSSEHTIFGMIFVLLMSCTDLAKAAVTIARLRVVCSCSLMVASFTAPLKSIKT